MHLCKTCIQYIVREDLSAFDERRFKSIFIELVGQGTVMGEGTEAPRHKSRSIYGNIGRIIKTLHSTTADFLNLNHSKGLVPTITRPTRVTYSTATLIDMVV